MSRNSPGGWQPLSGPRKQFLENWLRSRRIDLRFREVQPPLSRGAGAATQSDRTALAGRVAPFDSDPPGPGEIRLLSPRLTPDAERPVYVAAFRDWEDDWKLVAPFGPYEAPATPGELLLGREAPTLRVLCLWNAHSVPPDALRESWFIDRLTTEEMADAWSVFRHAATGAALPKPLQDRVGAPMAAGADPRIAYQTEEMSHMRALARAAMGAARLLSESCAPAGVIIHLPWVDKAHQEIELAQAAHGSGMPQYESLLISNDPPLRIRVCLESDWKTCSFQVLDHRGEASEALDHGTIKGAGGVFLKRISGSQAQVPMDRIAEGFTLETKSGNAIPLRQAP